jgi:hypothetical protein
VCPRTKRLDVHAWWTHARALKKISLLKLCGSPWPWPIDPPKRTWLNQLLQCIRCTYIRVSISNK